MNNKVTMIQDINSVGVIAPGLILIVAMILVGISVGEILRLSGEGSWVQVLPGQPISQVRTDHVDRMTYPTPVRGPRRREMRNHQRTSFAESRNFWIFSAAMLIDIDGLIS